jgi:hypothetical protein
MLISQAPVLKTISNMVSVFPYVKSPKSCHIKFKELQL